MFSTDKIPAFLLPSLGLDESEILLGAHSDMDENHQFCDVFFFATREKLIRVSGKLTEGKSHIPASFSLSAKDEWALCDLDSFMIEELLSGARFVCRDNDENFILLTAMTNFCKNSFFTFAKYLKQVKDTGDFTVQEEDDPSDRFCPKCGNRYPDRNRKICPKCMEKGKFFKRISFFFLKYKLSLLILLISLTAITVLSIVAPYLSSGFFYDKVLTEGSEYNSLAGVFYVLILVVLTRIGKTLASVVNEYITSIIAGKIVYDLKKTIFASIERLSLSFFTGRQTGGLMTQINNDANTIYDFFCNGVPYLLINVVQVAVLVVILFIINPILAAGALCTIPFFFICLRWLFRNSKKLHARRYSSTRSLNSTLSDVLSGIRVVKAFAKEKDETARFNQKNQRLAYSDRKLSVFNNYAWPLTGIILYLGVIFTWAIGGFMIIRYGKDLLTYGELLTFIAYVGMIYSPMYFFNSMINRTADCSNALQRLFEIMDTEPEVAECAHPVPMPEVKGHIEFRHVTFSYTKSRKIIDDVSFDVPEGSILGIVGHTGAGKSTLVNLLMRLYDVEDGEILIDGHNVKELSFADLHRNIAIVSQETYLFIGTILENIRYARPDATYDEVIAASKAAGAHDFIIKLPDAYATRIGFGFQDLSGGERQRLSIARAILRDPKILILDEATAAMDTETERRIQNALSELIRGKTTIMIAHRLSTLRDADNLVVIEDGKAVESGTHTELMKEEDGIYHRLYSLQLEALKNAGISEQPLSGLEGGGRRRARLFPGGPRK